VVTVDVSADGVTVEAEEDGVEVIKESVALDDDVTIGEIVVIGDGTTIVTEADSQTVEVTVGDGTGITITIENRPLSEEQARFLRQQLPRMLTDLLEFLEQLQEVLAELFR
jgi:hypothetical protein